MYFFFKQSYPKKIKENKARLISPTYSPTNGVCFKFWYHMYGPSVGELNIWLRQGNVLQRNFWTRSGNFGDQWRYGHVTVKSSLEFQMVIEGYHIKI
jgi:hypothetical protein